MSISGQQRQNFIPLWVKNEESFILSVTFDMYFFEYSSESLEHCRRGHINYFGIGIGFIFTCNPKITKDIDLLMINIQLIGECRA